MEKYRIINAAGIDYIINIEHQFTLKVIDPDMQQEYDYIPYKVVCPLFPEDITDIAEEMQGADMSCLLGLDTLSFEFEGMDITFKDDDLSDCNKQLWLETINFYCEQKLGKPASALRCYGYQYDLNELNWSAETLAELNKNSGFNFDIHLN